MKLEIKEVIKEIEKRILYTFPFLLIIIEEDEYDDEYFIYINSSEIYDSYEFNELIFNIKKELLWKNKIYNIFFSEDENKFNNYKYKFSNKIKFNTQIEYETNIGLEFRLEPIFILNQMESKILYSEEYLLTQDYFIDKFNEIRNAA